MKPQKAQHLHLELEKKNPGCIGKDYMVFEKHDGWYGYMDHGQPIMSRNMRAIPSLAMLSEELNDLDAARDGRLIFEIMVEGMPRFSDLNGYLNRKSEATDTYLLVHDCVSFPLEMPFYARHIIATDIVISLNNPRIQLATVLSEKSKNISEWHNLARAEWAKGNEGIILKQLDAIYTPGKRNAGVLKIKEELTLDLLVVGLEPGEGKYEGTLGSLRVREKAGIEHAVSGMTDEERKVWWNNPNAILCEVVEVRAMKRLTNGSLREPRFKAIRHDKTIEDID